MKAFQSLSRKNIGAIARQIFARLQESKRDWQNIDPKFAVDPAMMICTTDLTYALPIPQKCAFLMNSRYDNARSRLGLINSARLPSTFSVPAPAISDATVAEGERSGLNINNTFAGSMCPAFSLDEVVASNLLAYPQDTTYTLNSGPLEPPGLSAEQENIRDIQSTVANCLSTNYGSDTTFSGNPEGYNGMSARHSCLASGEVLNPLSSNYNFTDPVSVLEILNTLSSQYNMSQTAPTGHVAPNLGEFLHLAH